VLAPLCFFGPPARQYFADGGFAASFAPIVWSVREIREVLNKTAETRPQHYFFGWPPIR
jgi:hypothetical protein